MIEFSCSICLRSFPRLSKLKKHYKKRHRELTCLECCFCDYFTLDNSQFVAHKKADHPRDRFACQNCDYTTKSWKRISKHHTDVHVNDVSSESGVCGSTDNVIQQEVVEVKPEIDSENWGSSYNNFSADHWCDEMKSVVTDEMKSVVSDSQSQDMSDALTLEKNRTSEVYIKEKKRNTDQDFGNSSQALCACGRASFCQICSSLTVKKQVIRKHMRKTTTPKLFVCDLCEKSFETEKHLTSHRDLHSKENCFLCAYCDRYFNSSEDLELHSHQHLKSKPYRCEFCEKCYTSKYTLKRHLMIHEGQRPFQCEMCDYASSQRTTLDVHMRKHYNERDYQCKLCQYSSVNKVNLDVHMLTHNGEKPFRCNICGKKFRQRYHLINHKERIHRDLCD
ncbi:zinc finger protein 569-like [Physella acuta]|uniref:zinc finger protein 569-like n=1 Tax=Physella acuta TaxID=109671 RepID=UPI0027DC400C|nr:zinc finger protein 569-like [Physella acuta]